MNKNVRVTGVSGLLIIFFSMFLVSQLPAVDHAQTWDISYSYTLQPPGAGAPSPFNLLEGQPLPIPLSIFVYASGTVKVTSPTNVIQTLDVPSIDGGNFSHTFILDEAGIYSVEEKYMLTVEDATGLIGVKRTFTRTDTWNFNNSSPGGVLFELKDMHITNYDGELISDALEVVSILPEPCRPDPPPSNPGEDGLVEIRLRAAKDINVGDNLLDSISLSADWYKNSSLTAIADNEPPVIIHNPGSGYEQVGSPIYANVTDNIQVASVELRLTDSMSNDYQVEMTPIDEEGNYVGYIPYSARTGFGNYHIWAADLSGNEAVEPSSPQPIYLFGLELGDVNEDDDIDQTDANLVLQNAIGQISFTEKEKAIGDVSGDGTISSYDSGLILQYWQEIIDTFPGDGGGPSPSGSVDVSIMDYEDQPGNDITVPVMIGNTTGLGIIGIDLTFTYNSDILSLTSITKSGTLASQWNMYTDTTTPGQIKIAMAHYNELSGAGSIVKFEFHVSESATDGQTSPLNLSSMSIDEGNITANITNGLFTVITTINMDIPLGAGWNIFSICLDLEDNSLASVLGPIEGNVKSVWAYFSNPGWKRYVYDGPADQNDLDTIVPGQGYLIEMESADTLTISGTPLSSTSIILQPNWNLVGYNSREARSPASASLPAGTIVRSYDNATDLWRVYTQGGPTFLNDIVLMESGMGFWIHATGVVVWTVPSP